MAPGVAGGGPPARAPPPSEPSEWIATWPPKRRRSLRASITGAEERVAHDGHARLLTVGPDGAAIATYRGKTGLDNLDFTNLIVEVETRPGGGRISLERPPADLGPRTDVTWSRRPAGPYDGPGRGPVNTVRIREFHDGVLASDTREVGRDRGPTLRIHDRYLRDGQLYRSERLVVDGEGKTREIPPTNR